MTHRKSNAHASMIGGDSCAKSLICREYDLAVSVGCGEIVLENGGNVK